MTVRRPLRPTPGYPPVRCCWCDEPATEVLGDPSSNDRDPACATHAEQWAASYVLPVAGV